jgi:hypothetical protein
MEDDGRPVSFRRALGQAEFWLLFVTAVGGAMGLQWWVGVPLCVAGLSLSSLPKYIGLWPRAREAGAELMWWKTVGLSTFNALAASVAAFVLGIVVHRIVG